MKTLTISISENEFMQFGLKSEKIDFKELLDKVSLELAKQAVLKCQEIAKKVGLSEMTLDEINSEIKSVRNSAKNSS